MKSSVVPFTSENFYWITTIATNWSNQIQWYSPIFLLDSSIIYRAVSVITKIVTDSFPDRRTIAVTRCQLPSLVLATVDAVPEERGGNLPRTTCTGYEAVPLELVGQLLDLTCNEMSLNFRKCDGWKERKNSAAAWQQPKHAIIVLKLRFLVKTPLFPR